MALSVKLLKHLRGFSLDVDWRTTNGITVLFGYSGAGKSMTMKMLAGLMRPDTGYINLNSKVLFDTENEICLPPQERSLGYVFQDPSLFPHMTAEGNIAFGLPGMDRKIIKERVNETLDKFNIEKLRNRYPGQLSGGEKQKVTLARALIRRPSALLLDEPFSALDYPVRLEMRSLLLDIRRELGIPVILVTHDMEEARTLADRVIFYCAGRIEQDGTPDDILRFQISQSHKQNCRASTLMSRVRVS
jgi:molybdate transport system ATP-binding protein